MSVIDSRRWQRASAHLDWALDLSPSERAERLARLRADDPDTAADLEALLEEHARLSADGFLEHGPLFASPPPTFTGLTLGAYTLTTPLGQGGMGSVWLAERSDGRFDGQVAVKLLNAALVGRDGESRFRREGTILARLTHPNIARLIDAGISPTGQPYLVLERIDGRHIDKHCDAHRLAVEERLRLFLDVQAAVAHAHANLIVHRDLKPSNVLVDVDGRVKLLDFGIAKLLDREGDPAHAVLTHAEGLPMTPWYAAPEQMSGGAITTATDVYALGTLLFELLSGVHPCAPGTRGATDLTSRLLGREPIRLAEALDHAPAGDRDAIAADRGTTLDRLRRLLAGDLDTIVGKALKTDPGERYASVAAFADDLRRYLADQPISARPDTLGYRTAKFVRRNGRLLAGAVAAALVIAGLIGYHTVRLAQERDRAELEAAKASRISELLTSLLTGADPYRTPGDREPTVRNLLDVGAERVAKELGDRPDVQAELFTVIGRTYERMGLRAQALPLLEQALAIGRRTPGDDARVAQSLNDLGVSHREAGNFGRAQALLTESLAMRRRLHGPRDKDVAVTLVELARVHMDLGDLAAAEPLAREALEVRRAVFGDEHRETATSKNELALILLRRGDPEGAEPLLRDNVATTGRLLGPNHPNLAAAKANLGQVLLARGDAEGAETLIREAIDIDRRVFGEAHAEYAEGLHALSGALEAQSRLEEAEAVLQDAVRIARSTLGDTHPTALAYAASLARVRIARGEAASTEAELRRILDTRRRLYPTDRWRIAQAESLLAAALMAQLRHAEAEPLMLAAARVLQPIPGVQGRERAANEARLAELRRRTGR